MQATRRQHTQCAHSFVNWLRTRSTVKEYTRKMKVADQTDPYRAVTSGATSLPNHDSLINRASTSGSNGQASALAVSEPRLRLLPSLPPARPSSISRDSDLSRGAVSAALPFSTRALCVNLAGQLLQRPSLFVPTEPLQLT